VNQKNRQIARDIEVLMYVDLKYEIAMCFALICVTPFCIMLNIIFIYEKHAMFGMVLLLV
jgi:hypothetical protein